MEIVYWLLAVFTIIFIQQTFCDLHKHKEFSQYLKNSGNINPHSLYYRRDSQIDDHAVQINKEEPVVYTFTSQYLQRVMDAHSDQCIDNNCNVDPYYDFSKRLINLMILNANLDKNSITYEGKLKLILTEEELNVLKAFGKGHASIGEVDAVLRNVILPDDLNIGDSMAYLTDSIAMLIFKHRIVFSVLTIIVTLFIFILKTQWTLAKVFIFFLWLMFIVSFIFTWLELIIAAQAKLAAKREIFSEIPEACGTKNYTYFGSLKQFFGFGKNDCFNYYEAHMTEPILQVSPLHAFNVMCTKFVLNPLSIFGDYLVEFIEKLGNILPFPFNYVAMIVLILLCIIGLFVGSWSLLFVNFGGRFKIWIPFGGFEISGKNSTNKSCKRECIEDKRIERLEKHIEILNGTLEIKALEDKKNKLELKNINLVDFDISKSSMQNNSKRECIENFKSLEKMPVDVFNSSLELEAVEDLEDKTKFNKESTLLHRSSSLPDMPKKNNYSHTIRNKQSEFVSDYPRDMDFEECKNITNGGSEKLDSSLEIPDLTVALKPI